MCNPPSGLVIGFNNSIHSYIERLHHGNLANFFAACVGDAANLNTSLQNYQISSFYAASYLKHVREYHSQEVHVRLLEMVCKLY
jgi:hypothetical protein